MFVCRHCFCHLCEVSCVFLFPSFLFFPLAFFLLGQVSLIVFSSSFLCHHAQLKYFLSLMAWLRYLSSSFLYSPGLLLESHHLLTLLLVYLLTFRCLLLYPASFLDLNSFFPDAYSVPDSGRIISVCILYFLMALTVTFTQFCSTIIVYVSYFLLIFIFLFGLWVPVL